MAKVKIPDYLGRAVLSFISGAMFFTVAILLINLTGINANTGCILI